MLGRKTESNVDKAVVNLENASKAELIQYILGLSQNLKEAKESALTAKFLADFQFLQSTHEILDLKENNIVIKKENKALKKELILTRDKLADVINKGVPRRPANTTYKLFTIRPVIIDVPHSREKEERKNPTLGS